MIDELNEQNSQDYERNLRYLEYISTKKTKSEQKTPLVLAVWGLLLGVLYGVGIIFSIISLILLKVKMVKKGTTFKWTVFLAIIGVLLSFLFILFETTLAITIFNNLQN